MAPTTAPGANPAPLYKEKSNAIAALMAQHTSSPSLTFLSSLSARKNNNNSPSSAGLHKKTPAQLAAAAEDYEFDRLAQYDDNMGVGMFAPENRKEKEEERRRKELEDRRLKARLGLGPKRRKGTEWEGVNGVSQAAAAAASDEDEELGRSGVGRAKKRKRVVANVGADLPGDLSKAEVAAAAKDDDAPETDGAVETRNNDEQTAGSSPQPKMVMAGVVDTEDKGKRRRKKKKKNKPKTPKADIDTAMLDSATG